MPTNEETKLQIDDGLKQKDQALEEKKVATTGDLATNLQATQHKEIAQKSLEFEENAFKIDSTNWKEETRSDAFVKVSPAGDVIEYLDGPAKGEQLFIEYNSFIKYVAEAKGCSIQEAEQKYLLTREEVLTKMKEVDYAEFYNTQIKGHLAGCWHPSKERCLVVGKRSSVWLVGGDNVEFGQSSWNNNDGCASRGFSGRLLKN